MALPSLMRNKLSPVFMRRNMDLLMIAGLRAVKGRSLHLRRLPTAGGGNRPHATSADWLAADDALSFGAAALSSSDDFSVKQCIDIHSSGSDTSHNSLCE